MGQWFQKAPDDDDAIHESVKVLWGIWLHRNTATFENVVEDHVLRLISSLNWVHDQNRILDINDLFTNRSNMGVASPGDSFVLSNSANWCPHPCFDWFVIDGAWKELTVKAGAAWVGMDNKGN
ncbi:unnamed protein product [Camellia sinensis]